MNCKTSGLVKKSRILSLITYAFLLMGLSAEPVFSQQAFTGSDGVEVTITDMSRIVSVGAAVTEIIFALDAAENVIAVDESSVYPEEAEALQKVSFTRNLSAEGVLSMEPSVILASGAAGPETAIRQIRSTGVPLLKFTADETVEGALLRVEQLGKVFGREEHASRITERMKRELEAADTALENVSERPVVLFIYARGPNNMMVAGNRTSAKTVIELAGGVNAFDDFDGYKPLTPEAVVSTNPDVILMMNSGIESVGGTGGMLRSPGVNLTKAAENERIYSMDGAYLLGFGPRLGRAVLDLMQLLHPGLPSTDDSRSSDEFYGKPSPSDHLGMGEHSGPKTIEPSDGYYAGSLGKEMVNGFSKSPLMIGVCVNESANRGLVSEGCAWKGAASSKGTHP